MAETDLKLPSDLARRLAALPPDKRLALFAQLQKEKERAGEPAPGAGPGQIPRRPRTPGGLYPVSFAQQRLWFLHQYDAGSPEYNIPQMFRLRGRLDAAALTRALDAIVLRHEALRTTFKGVEGHPVQWVAEDSDLEVPLDDLTGRPQDGRETEARRRAAEEARRPIDLSQSPLLCARLYRLAAEEHLLFLNVHHIVYDGWSQGIFLRELAVFYAAFQAGLPPDLPALPVQYVDFSAWQRDWMSGEVLARQLAYWRRQLAAAPPLELPTDRPRPALRTHAGAARAFALSRGLTEDLARLAQAEGATLFMLLGAAFKALLHHHTGQEDITVGTLLANRRRPELEGLIGFFANTLALRTDLGGDPTFRELLRREREVALDAYAHQDLPFEKLVEEINPPRDLARTPLFQAMLILQNAPGGPLLLPGLSLEAVPVDSRTAKTDLTLYMTEEEELTGFVEYNCDLFEAGTIDRLLGHFQLLLAAVAAAPQLPLSGLPLLGEAERRELLCGWNDTRAELPAVTLHGLILARLAETPDAVAAVCADQVLSCGALAARAGRLAHHLRSLGAGPETLVGVAVERSLDLLVAVLGVLASGGAYVPLDPDYPRERLAHMLDDASLPLLVSHEKLLDKIPAAGARLVVLDRDAAALDAAPQEAPGERAVPGGLAYVIYTSGSTGRPKGVQVPHRAVVNFLLSMARRPGLGRGDALLAVTTLSFDIAGLELYLPLVTGGTVLLATRGEASAGEELRALLERSGATALQATPATWRLLFAAGWPGAPHLRVLCGGEALPRDLANQLAASTGALWNVYGPTEATIWSTLERLEPGEGPVSIGRPLANTQIYLLSRRLEPVPVGVPGELWIGGAGLARGYRNRPDLTGERFLPHPFPELVEEPGARAYRTGDLARFLPDGRLEFLGRIDHQVKVRGFRIELGDLETALAAHPAVVQAVALAREDRPGDKRLVAYLVPRPGQAAPDVTALRAWLKDKLPEYMMPALFLPLAAFPLTPNGKVDRRALPKPDPAATAKEHTAPRNQAEESLAAIWAEVLSLERVGIHDDFFELGGDSLLVIRVVTKANKAGLGVTTRQVFQHRTVAELAAAAGSIEIVAEQGPVTGPLGFTPAQLHFLELRHPAERVHSLGFLLEGKDAPLDPAVVEAALTRVVEHHDNLRVRLCRDASGWRLLTDPPGPQAVSRIDLAALPEARHREALQQAMRETVQSYDLEQGPLFKALFFDLPGRLLLFLTAHFLPVDVGSWQILFDDLDLACRETLAGRPVRFQAKTTSARQWAGRLADRGRPGVMPTEERDYWLAQTPSAPARFPMDHETGPNDWPSARHVPVELDEADTEILLQQLPRAHGVQIDALLLTAILSAFEPWTGARSLPILLLGHGREALWDDMDLSRTVGWFNTIYPVLLDLGPDPDPAAAARGLNQQLRRVPFGGIGYGVLRYFSTDRKVVDRFTAALEPQVFLNYFGPDNAKELSGLCKLEHFSGYALDRKTLRMCPITIGGYVLNDRLVIKWEYSVNLHRPTTIEALARRCGDVLRRFVADFRSRT
ncbi:MAG TPA: non-ribosomal peptide synthetase [Acidobacteria bacterium]|nr:non-ribosomal peptide synthetase [Acidobacteriota bacterium]